MFDACRVFAPKLTLGGEPLGARLERERQQLWPVAPSDLAARWAPEAGDLLFLAGVDWRYLRSGGLEHLRNPRINLIQGVRHAEAGSELYGYLGSAGDSRLRRRRSCRRHPCDRAYQWSDHDHSERNRRRAATHGAHAAK